ncbi:MAG: glycine--tRNA ligase, partial [Armatimonadetes bacterium]|nr:glycine--tRNA ligase [Armatimonadota bacterium]
LVDAYHEEEVAGRQRLVMRFHKDLAPIKVAVLPLLKNRPELVELAHNLNEDLRRFCTTMYDDTASIGKLYRRQDEIGTLFCVTVDVDSLTDNAVTLRERDTMAQERIGVDRLAEVIRGRLGVD